MSQGYGLTFVVAIFMTMWLIVAALLFGWICPTNALTLLVALIPVCIAVYAMLGRFRR